MKTEQDNADLICGARENLAEIEVKRQHDPLLGEALLEDVAIRQAPQTSSHK